MAWQWAWQGREREREIERESARESCKERENVRERCVGGWLPVPLGVGGGCLLLGLGEVAGS